MVWFQALGDEICLGGGQVGCSRVERVEGSVVFPWVVMLYRAVSSAGLTEAFLFQPD